MYAFVITTKTNNNNNNNDNTTMHGEWPILLQCYSRECVEL